jgi:hypothetical protein
LTKAIELSSKYSFAYAVRGAAYHDKGDCPSSGFSGQLGV